MADFAARSMIRLVARGMARQGLGAPSPQAARSPAARVQLEDKRALLSALKEQHGALALLRMAEALGDMKDDIVAAVMLRARSPQDLIARWQGLERYMHSRHRIALVAMEDRAVRLRHYSLARGAPPLPEEDILVAAVIAKFLELAGTVGLRARWGDGRDFFRDGAFCNPGASLSNTEEWHFTWKGFASAAEQTSAPFDQSLAETCRGLFAQDMHAAWRLADVASRLGLSRRTLQRRLKEEGQSLQTLLAETRLALAGRHLWDGRIDLGEIGYLCGYSDQAHFSREFRRRVGMPPRAYRQLFNVCPEPKEKFF